MNTVFPNPKSATNKDHWQEVPPELCADPEVRIGVCDNSATPAGLLMVLAGNGCVNVRYAIAENSQALGQIRVLARDENPYVADRAVRTLNHLESRDRVCARSGQPDLLSAPNCA